MPILHFFAYLAFIAVEGVLRLLPIEWVFVAGECGGNVAYRLLRRRRRLALRNLRLALGDEFSESELHAINRRHFQLLGANLLAGLKAATMPPRKIWERVTTSGDEPTERPRGWVALISHTGNWEVYSHLIDRLPEYRFATVYQPLRNGLIDRHIRFARARSGITLFDRRTQLLSCVRFLREGGVVGVLGDQGAGYAGLWTPLFGRLTSSTTLPAILAIHSGFNILPIAIATCGRARWRITTLEVISSERDTVEEMTARANRILEQKIRQSPADWLWAHDRWKALRPHFLFTREQRRVFIPESDASSLQPFRILIVSPRSAEEARASFDAVRAIKAGRPDAHVTVLLPESLAKVWKANEAVDALLSWRAGDSAFGLADKIRASAEYDVSISFASDWRSAIAVWRAGVPLRVGERSKGNTWFCNQHPRLPNETAVARQRYLEIAWTVGADITPLQN